MPTSVDTDIIVLPDGTALSSGIDLAAGEIVGINDIFAKFSHIRWIRQTDGSLLAQIYNAFDSNDSAFGLIQTNAHTNNNNATGSASLQLGVGNAGGISNKVELDLTQQGNGATSRIEALFTDAANNVVQRPRIMDQAGLSSFLQLFSGPAKRLAQFGKLGPVTSDGGGWLNFTLPIAFASAIDVLLVTTTTGGVDFGTEISISEVVDAGHFRSFVNAAGRNVACSYLAIGH